mmetsp:Transcript_23328/g.54603  ORF Transcript_23328/g.54603 Transcript_23328/m.54603 type:complete len:111 (-) Transcript_23328:3-335(-)
MFGTSTLTPRPAVFHDVTEERRKAFEPYAISGTFAPTHLHRPSELPWSMDAGVRQKRAGDYAPGWHQPVPVNAVVRSPCGQNQRQSGTAAGLARALGGSKVRFKKTSQAP